MNNNRKNNFYYLIGMGIASAAMLASCSSTGKSTEGNAKQTVADESMGIDDNYLILSDDQTATINKVNNFALKLFNEEIDMESKVMSPFSVSSLMGMLANGASGSTLSQIKKTLGLTDESIENMNTTFKAFANYATKSGQATNIKIANSVVVNKNIKLKGDFAKSVSSMYDAKVESCDFASPKTVTKINDWCKTNTNGMIPSIVNSLDADAVSVLLNAIYFNGTWESKFDKNATKMERFQGYTRDIKRTYMMHKQAKYMYAKKSNYAAVKLPYSGNKYSMTVILPDAGVSVGDVFKHMSADSLSNLSRDMDMYNVDLKLPRFTVSTDLNLNNVISSLGAPSIFKPSADFSKMSDTDMFVSAMLHKAKIEVTEEGTKAAAVTAAIMTMSSLSPSQELTARFYANRPFAYAITENTTGAILFIGQFTGDNL